MRVISGVAGGIPLQAPPGTAVRPSSDRLKEALFASLGDIRGWTVADLYAGTGALGLEALSRGAARVVFVERDRHALACIRENTANVLHAFNNIEPGLVRVHAGDVAGSTRTLSDYAGQLDLVLADPPYVSSPGEYGAERLLLDPLFAAWAGQALLVIEHASRLTPPCGPTAPWHVLRRKVFGIRAFSLYRLRQALSDRP